MQITDLVIDERNTVEKTVLKNAEGIDPENYKAEWKVLNGEQQVRFYDEVRTTPFVRITESQIDSIQREASKR